MNALREEYRALRAEFDDAVKEGDQQKIADSVSKLSVVVRKLFMETQKSPPGWAEIKKCYGCYVQ